MGFGNLFVGGEGDLLPSDGQRLADRLAMDLEVERARRLSGRLRRARAGVRRELRRLGSNSPDRHDPEVCEFMAEVGREFSGAAPARGLPCQGLRSRYHDPDPPTDREVMEGTPMRYSDRRPVAQWLVTQAVEEWGQPVVGDLRCRSCGFSEESTYWHPCSHCGDQDTTLWAR